MPVKLELLEHLLFAAYLILFAWLVTRVKFFRRSGLTPSQLVILFLLKVMAGIFYGWIGVYYGQMAQMIDTWAYHVESLQEYHLLLTHPGTFFTSIFQTTYDSGYANFLSTHQSWWNDVKANFLIKIMGVFNVFSFGHYYVNVIFYSFLTLFGPIAFYRVMKDIFPGRGLSILAACFLVPSFLYWTSGLHKEGMIFLGLTLMIFHFYFGFKEKRFPLYRILMILLGFGLMTILRNFLLITFLPPLLAWVLARKLPWRPLFTYLGVTALFVLFFFTARYIDPRLDFPQATVVKQQEFLALGGGSAVPVQPLEPTAKSFLVNAPQALSLAIIRPYPSDVRHLLSLAAAIEINALLLLFVVFLVYRRKPAQPLSPALLFLLFFSFAVLMMIGYSVDVLGAIVRYRSVVLPMLVVPMTACTDWKRIGAQLNSIINKNNI